MAPSDCGWPIRIPTPPLSIPATINIVHVDGISRTRKELLECRLRPLFAVANWADLSRELHISRQRLVDLGVFRDVTSFVDTSGPDGYSAHFVVREKGFLGLDLRPTLTGVNRLFADGVIEFQNVDGKGRTIEFTANRCLWRSFTAFGQEEASLRLKSPFTLFPFAKWTLGVGAVRDVGGPPDYFLTALRSYVTLPLRNSSHSQHTFGVSLFVDPSNPGGNDTTLLFEHCFERNTQHFEDGWPARGSSVLLRNWLPLSRPGVNSQSEHELTLSAHVQPLARFPRLTLTGAFRFGAQTAAHGSNGVRPQRLNACTGPGGVRGFVDLDRDGPVRGCGVLHIFCPLPLLRGWLGSLLRFHVFGALGGSGAIPWHLCGPGVQASLGVGVAGYWDGFGRAEVSVCLPVSEPEASPRLCLGIGTELL